MYKYIGGLTGTYSNNHKPTLAQRMETITAEIDVQARRRIQVQKGL